MFSFPYLSIQENNVIQFPITLLEKTKLNVGSGSNISCFKLIKLILNRFFLFVFKSFASPPPEIPHQSQSSTNSPKEFAR